MKTIELCEARYTLGEMLEKCQSVGVMPYRKMGYGERSQRLIKPELAEALVGLHMMATIENVRNNYNEGLWARQAIAHLRCRIDEAERILDEKGIGLRL